MDSPDHPQNTSTANKGQSAASFYLSPTKTPTFRSTNSCSVIEQMLAYVRNGNPTLKISVKFYELTPGDDQDPEPMSQTLVELLDYEGYKELPSL